MNDLETHEAPWDALGAEDEGFFSSNAARTITALTVVSFGRQLLNLNIVGGNKNKNTKQHQYGGRR